MARDKKPIYCNSMLIMTWWSKLAALSKISYSDLLDNFMIKIPFFRNISLYTIIFKKDDFPYFKSYFVKLKKLFISFEKSLTQTTKLTI